MPLVHRGRALDAIYFVAVSAMSLRAASSGLERHMSHEPVQSIPVIANEVRQAEQRFKAAPMHVQPAPLMAA
jgi:hypothetical protein